MNRYLVAISLALAGVTLAAQTDLKLSVNGKASSLPAVVIGGQTYVPLGALTTAGVGATTNAGTLSLTLPGNAPAGQMAGGANQIGAVEGCLGETLFNQAWRLKVLNVVPFVGENGKTGYQLNVEARNAANKTSNFMASGLQNLNTYYTLATADGNAGIWALPYDVSAFAGRDVPPGGMFTYSFKFRPLNNTTVEDSQRVPAKLILNITTKGYGFKYTIPDPSFRVNLTCKK
jgi:hypothetical protein